MKNSVSKDVVVEVDVSDLKVPTVCLFIDLNI